MNRKKTGICVYGASSASISPTYLEYGTILGKLIAQKNWRLIFGAGDTGMMGAVVRGAKEAGGNVTGIAPTFFDHPGILYEGHDDLLFTRTMRERKAFMETLSDGFIVTPGGIGTLEEFFEIMTLKQLKQLNAPLVLLNIDGFYDTLLHLLEEMKSKSFLTQYTIDLIYVANTPEEAVQYLEDTFQKTNKKKDDL